MSDPYTVIPKRNNVSHTVAVHVAQFAWVLILAGPTARPGRRPKGIQDQRRRCKMAATGAKGFPDPGIAESMMSANPSPFRSATARGYLSWVDQPPAPADVPKVLSDRKGCAK